MRFSRPHRSPSDATGGASTPVRVQRKCASCAAAHSEDEMCDECRAKARAQRSLIVGSATDALELEADRVADLVLSGGSVPTVTPISGAVAPSPGVDPHAVWQPGAGDGHPFDAATQRDMEQRFRRDFTNVRIHTSARAAGAARALDAQAYALGPNIVFGSGHYAPHSLGGRRLIAHELTHVIQQHAAPNPVAQCDFAIEPRGVDQTQRPMSEADITAAITVNASRVKDKKLLAKIRDVLGIAEQPAVSDRELALAVAQFQAEEGVAQDGQLGPVTMLLVVEEFQAEGLGPDAESVKKTFGKGVLMDIDTSFCGCEPVLDAEIKKSDHFIAEYTACGADATVKTGPQVDDCVKARAKAAGQPVRVVATTAPGGGIALSGLRKGTCGRLMERIDLAHEQIHSVHEHELQQAHGTGGAFTKAREDKADWVSNEIQSRKTDKSLALWALAVLKGTCP